METIYFVIVAFLLILAVFDLFVGVSNDAVNFLQSAIGAKVARFRTVLVVASAGVLIGAVMSAGMMDVARHGIMQPENYSFAEVMTIFLAGDGHRCGHPRHLQHPRHAYLHHRIARLRASRCDVYPRPLQDGQRPVAIFR